MQNRNNCSSPLVAEKVIAVLSYATAGIVGFVWFLIGHFTKQNLRPFLKYHIYQSIFLAVLFSVGFYILDILFKILSYIPIIKNIVFWLSLPFIMPLLHGLTIVNIAVLILIVYLCVGVLLNRFSFIPWVSNIIRYNIERG